MKRTSLVTLIVVLVAFFLISMSIYTVYEGQKGILLRLGEIIKDPATGKAAIKEPGLHFKLPFINNVRKFDIRIQNLDIESSRIVTVEQKDVIVDYYVKWRITNLPLYYTRTGGNEFVARTLLRQKLNEALRAEFGVRTLKQVVSDDRAEIMQLLNEQASRNVEGLGLSVIDVRIKSIDLPKEVSNSVYARMRAERKRVATEFRAQGKARANVIRAQADAKREVILATAQKNAQQTRAEGDKSAAHVYSESYKRDSEFYAFYRSLKAYRDTFDDKHAILVLQPDSQFFEYFNSAKGGKLKKHNGINKNKRES